MADRTRIDDELARKILGVDKRKSRVSGSSTGSGGISDDRSRDAFVNPMTTEGDLIVGGVSGSPARLAVGTDGQVLTADAAAADGIKWAAAPGSDEASQDAVGTILVDSSSIDFTYDDATPSITAIVILEWLQDTVAAMLTGGTHTDITVTYQDATGLIDLAVTGGGGGLTQEQIEDFLGTSTLVAGNNVDITYNDVANTITIDVEALTSADLSDFSEAVDDRVAALLIAGNNIDLTYNDAANTLTIDVEALTSADISDFTEASQDAIGAMIADTASINLTYTDATPELKADIIDSYIEDLVGTSSGGDTDSSPVQWLHRHRFGSVSANGGVGVGVFGFMDAGTSQGTVANGDDADGTFVTHTASPATVGTTFGRANTSAVYRADWGMTFAARMKTGSDISSQRIWFGMSNSGTLMTVDTVSADTAAFRYSTNAGDTNWQAVVGNSTGSTVVDTGVAVAANAAHWFRIHFGTSKAKFYIDDVLVADLSVANGDEIPSGGVQMGWYARVALLVAASRSFKFGAINMSTLN